MLRRMLERPSVVRLIMNDVVYNLSGVTRASDRTISASGNSTQTTNSWPKSQLEIPLPQLLKLALPIKLPRDLPEPLSILLPVPPIHILPLPRIIHVHEPVLGLRPALRR
ncbi:hypothetical protein VTK26DRAFT_2191 [Humicola hyalothermophila]